MKQGVKADSIEKGKGKGGKPEDADWYKRNGDTKPPKPSYDTPDYPKDKKPKPRPRPPKPNVHIPDYPKDKRVSEWTGKKFPRGVKEDSIEKGKGKGESPMKQSWKTGAGSGFAPTKSPMEDLRKLGDLFKGITPSTRKKIDAGNKVRAARAKLSKLQKQDPKRFAEHMAKRTGKGRGKGESPMKQRDATHASGGGYDTGQGALGQMWTTLKTGKDLKEQRADYVKKHKLNRWKKGLHDAGTDFMKTHGRKPTREEALKIKKDYTDKTTYESGKDKRNFRLDF